MTFEFTLLKSHTNTLKKSDWNHNWKHRNGKRNSDENTSRT